MDKINRRKVLKNLGTGAAGSALFSSAGGADLTSGDRTAGKGNSSSTNEDRDRKQVKFEKREKELSLEDAEVLVSNLQSQKSTNGVPGLEFTHSDLNRVATYVNGDRLAESKIIGTNYGDMNIFEKNGEIEAWQLKLDRKRVPPEAIAALSGNVGWPEQSQAVLVPNSDDELVFSRTTSPSETKELLHDTALSTSRSVVTLQGKVSTGVSTQAGSDGERPTARAISDGRVYKIETGGRGAVSIDQIQETDAFTAASVDCDDVGVCCAADIALAYPGCAAGVIPCSAAGVVGLACLVGMLNLCLPNLALVGLSGCCTKTWNHCQDIL